MKIVVRQICVPDYRRGLFNALATRCESLSVYSGPVSFSPSIQTIQDTQAWLKRCKNYFIAGRRFAWLESIESRSLFCDLMIHELNPRILSQWRDMNTCRRLGIKFVLWGHAWGKAGANSLEFKIRNIINRRADGIIAYTEQQAAVFRQHVGEVPVIAAPNACMSRSDCYVTGVESDRDAVIYVGRLVRNKKVALLIQGFAKACQMDPAFRARLCIVGDGPERAKLEVLANNCGIADRVTWLGHQAAIVVLSKAYSKAFVSVSPGYVGLSLTQSFAFGVPALIARDEPHSPEIEAAQEGKNAAFFQSNNTDDLGQKLVAAWRDWRGIEGKRHQLAEWTGANYSFELMAERFVEMAKMVGGQSRC